MEKKEKEKDFECNINRFGELRLENKKYIVALTDIQSEYESGRVRHKFILTEII